MTRPKPSTPPGALRHALVVAALVAVALVVRSLGFEYVFVDDEIVFPPADPQYHLRRALYTLSRFPDVLLFDPYINYPDGAPVPWPPLFDFTLGALGRLLGGSVRDLERVAAWSGPVCAAIAVVPIYLAGARLGSRRVGAVAGVLFALLPISVVYTRVGNADHHAAVAMIGAWLLYVVLALVDPAASRRRVVGLGVALFAARTAMLLTWHGSLLYLAPAEALLLLGGIVTGRSALLAAQAASAAASLLVIGALLSVSPTPLGGPYSSIALSRLHVLAVAAVAVVSGGLLVALRTGRATSVQRRFAWSVAAGVAFVALLLVWPGPREGLTLAFRFLTLGDEVGAITGEQTPLFALGDRLQGPPATHSWGFFAYLLPLAPLAGLIAARGRTAGPGVRAAGWTLMGWGLLFCTLASVQRRYGNDAAPAAALLFALALVAVVDRLVRRLGWPARSNRRAAAAALLASVLVVSLLAPAIRSVYGPRARASAWALQNEDLSSRGARTGVAYTLHRFAGVVRAVTPETGGYLEPGAPPGYGVISHANLGHALQYRARRATATDPFWWYIGRENWDRSHAFLEAKTEREALVLAEALGARYLVTMPGHSPGTIAARLHARDGVGAGSLAHFRLVSEAPREGLSIGALFGGASTRAIPYKLFEIVPGAILEIPAEIGQSVQATVEVETPIGRRIVYRGSGQGGPDGLARLRVPYPTLHDGASSVASVARATGPYAVRVGGALRRVHVSEQKVRDGGVVRVAAGSE